MRDIELTLFGAAAPFERKGNNWQCFYDAVKQLAHRLKDELRKALENTITETSHG